MKLKGRALCFSVLVVSVFSNVALANMPTVTNTNEAVPGEYVVRLKKSASKLSKQQISQKLRTAIKSEIPSLNLVVVKRASFESTRSAVKTLAVNDIVEVVEPNYIYRINKTSNDPLMGQLWGLKNIGQSDSEGSTGVAGVDIDVERAWDIETGSRNVIVAVIDTGIDYNHPDLAANMWKNEIEANGVVGVDDDNNGVIDDIHGYNAINNSGNPMDDQGHGSHCAGTIGAKGNDEKGIVGVAWDTQLMAVKFLDSYGSGTLEDAVKAIDYATKMGAKVLSNSWGGGEYSQILFDTIEASNKAGAIFIAAAGNSYSNNDSVESYPATFEVDNIVAVAAINNRGEIADFSNYGKKTVHVAAPGVNIYSSTGGSYDSWSGTSMATPHVSGIAALVWSKEPNLSAADIKLRLMQTSRPLAGVRNKTRTGGIVNAYNALTNTTPPPDPNDPMNWETMAVEYASASPYLPNTKEIIEIKVEGASEFALYFEKFDTEGSYDTVKLIDAAGNTVQIISGRNDELFTNTITGNSVKLAWTSDTSVEKSGWKITKIAVKKASVPVSF